jgi:hypothetical protein
MWTKKIPAVGWRLLWACALPLAAWAQASGESAETGPADAASPPAAAPRPLRQAVEAQSQSSSARPRDRADSPGDRRLTAAQRQELREQVRRAWDGRGAAQSTPERPPAPR